MKRKWNFIPISWKVSTENQVNWKDIKNNICSENYVKVRILKIFGIPVFRTIKALDAKHESNEFTKNKEIVGYK